MTATVRRAAGSAQAPARALPQTRPSARPSSRPRRPDLRVVQLRRRRLGAIGLLGSLTMFVLLFGVVVFHTVLVQNQQRLDTLQLQIRDAQATYQARRLEVARLESPARVVADATARLGMVPPPGTTYLTPSASAAAEVGASSPASSQSNDRSGEWSGVKPYLSEHG